MRRVLNARDLDFVARCPHALNYLDRLRANSNCTRCYHLARVGHYILQRNFRGRNLPSLATVQKTYKKFMTPHGPEIAEVMAMQDELLLQSLMDWGKEVADHISLIDADAEIHLGSYTVVSDIDAVLYMDEAFHLVKFICDSDFHQEEVLSYKTLFDSMWLRKNFGVSSNNIMIVQLSDGDLYPSSFKVGLSENLLQNTISHILSNIDLGRPANAEELDSKLESLPRIFGSHCWPCRACFKE